MNIACYQVDAFTKELFRGNPAAVCPLAAWLDVSTMQAIALENNLSETAFLVADENEPARYRIRWFTPTVEVELCGHATLASAYVLLSVLNSKEHHVTFDSLSGPLYVRKESDGALTLDFPSAGVHQEAEPKGMLEALSLSKEQVNSIARGRGWLVECHHASDVRSVILDRYQLISSTGNVPVIVTAPGDGQDSDVDFVSRFFAPGKGVDEDPVTGSAHCSLAPYWSQKLGMLELHARQVSARTGEILCRIDRDRVLLTGHAVLAKTGTFHLAE